MSTLYDRSCNSRNASTTLPHMRLPNYKSLHLRRYHPYATTRPRTSCRFPDVTEPEDDSDPEDVTIPSVRPLLSSISLSLISEDDCMAGLRVVLSQLIGRDSTQVRLGCIPLVIDFVLAVRSRLRKNGAMTCSEVVIPPPPAAPKLSA